MATLGVSEFTFGYAFLYEQTQRNWQDLRAVPVLPSLQQEASKGWDAQLPLNGTDFYYQFKLSDHLSRTNATYIRNGTYSGPYFRAALHKAKRNRQHQRLKEHVQNNPNTYYVAPEITDLDEFNSAFLSSQLTNSCRIIPLAECENISDSKQHYITFAANNPAWILHSDEANRHEKSFFGRDIEKIYRHAKDRWERIDEGFAQKMFDKTVESARKLVTDEEKRTTQPIIPLLDFNAANQPREEILHRTSQVLSVFFGLTLVVVGETP